MPIWAPSSTTISTGSDFETALWDTTRSAYTLAEYYTNGTKDEPEWKEGYGLQADNVSYEVAVPVSYTKDQFVQSIARGIETMTSTLPDTVELHFVSSTDYDLELLQSSENAMLFGCDPDNDAYTGHINPKPTPGQTMTTRYFGFHVHVGYPDATEETSRKIIQVLDANLLVPFLLSEGVDLKRLNAYGRPGNHRLKSYGFEYRSADARLTKHAALVYDEVQNAVDFVLNGGNPTHTVDDVYTALYTGQLMPKYQ